MRRTDFDAQVARGRADFLPVSHIASPSFSLRAVLGEFAPAAAGSADSAAELDRILRASLVRSVFQPIVDLDTGAVVAYEALSRGPGGSPLELPGPLFSAAVAEGRLAELEWACRVSAIRTALDCNLRRPLSLFVNVEPSMIAAPIPEWAREVMDRGREELDIVLELTERALVARPGDVLAAVPRLRELGCAIAVDDVGADHRSLAFMPFLRPEIIKLDLSLTQGRPTPQIASVVHAVNDEAERTGALVLAEGIESDHHLMRARALGARYGQGWRFGRPGPLPADVAEPRRADAERPAPRLATPRLHGPAAAATPFELVARDRPARRGTKRLLLEYSLHLEAHVASHPDAAVLVASFQAAEHFTPRTAQRYGGLAKRAAFVGALGVGLPDEPVGGVRGASLTESEPLRGEWDVIVVHPHFAAAFVARDVGDVGVPDGERRFDFCLTYERELVVQAAEALLKRVAPRGELPTFG